MKAAHKHKADKTLGLVITDGVGYRNFVLSSFLTEAKQKFRKIIIFSGLPAAAYDSIDTNIQIVELPVFYEKKQYWFFRKLKEIAHLQKHCDNPGIADNLAMNRKKGSSPRALLTRFIYGISALFHSETAILRYERLQERSFTADKVVKTYGKLLAENNPDMLFFTHQRPPFIASLVFMARKLNIPSYAFIFSWDNLASKGRMAATFDQYLVWSTLMKEELLRFYPKTSAEKIHIVGTPQFEPYANPPEISREGFLKQYGLESNKKIICYSCADRSIGPNDPLVISSIMKAIRSGVLAGCQLLVRTSPAEDASRFSALKTEFPEIKWNHPKWHQTREKHPEPWSQRIPLAEDIEGLKAVLAYSDINVNMCSTMSLDFMIYGKPVINTVFGNPGNGLYNDQRFLEYEHYQHVVQSGAVKIAKDEKELTQALQEYLKNPQQNRDEQERLLEKEIGVALDQTTHACVKALL